MERQQLERRDADDPLGRLRSRFHLPEGVIYLDGNSLGAMQPAVAETVRRTAEVEWADGLIRSWNTAGWVDLPARIAARLAPLLGVHPDEVAVTDSTSADLFKVVVAMARLRPDRRIILTDDRNFPTDIYVAGGAAELLGMEVRVVPGDRLAEAIDEHVAVVTATEVDYRTGRRHDLTELTRRAHDAGALTVWDLSHSTGAVHVDLNACRADAAVGCTYKYLNGGPGAPAYLFVARRHHEVAHTPLKGWFGHAAPFEFDATYTAADGAARFLDGTPPVLSMAALETALEVWDDLDTRETAARGQELTELFIGLADARLDGLELELVTPRAGRERGAQVSLSHPEAYRVMRALIDHGVIGDHRPPDLLRFGFAPLYVSRTDVWDAVETLRRILVDEVWREDRYAGRDTVV